MEHVLGETGKFLQKGDRDSYFADKDKRKELGASFSKEDCLEAYNEQMKKAEETHLSKIPFFNSSEDKAIKSWEKLQNEMSRGLMGEKLAAHKEKEGREVLIDKVIGGNYLLDENTDTQALLKEYHKKNMLNIREKALGTAPTDAPKPGM